MLYSGLQSVGWNLLHHWGLSGGRGLHGEENHQAAMLQLAALYSTSCIRNLLNSTLFHKYPSPVLVWCMLSILLMVWLSQPSQPTLTALCACQDIRDFKVLGRDVGKNIRKSWNRGRKKKSFGMENLKIATERERRKMHAYMQRLCFRPSKSDLSAHNNNSIHGQD